MQIGTNTMTPHLICQFPLWFIARNFRNTLRSRFVYRSLMHNARQEKRSRDAKMLTQHTIQILNLVLNVFVGAQMQPFL